MHDSNDIECRSCVFNSYFFSKFFFYLNSKINRVVWVYAWLMAYGTDRKLIILFFISIKSSAPINIKTTLFTFSPLKRENILKLNRFNILGERKREQEPKRERERIFFSEFRFKLGRVVLIKARSNRFFELEGPIYSLLYSQCSSGNLPKITLKTLPNMVLIKQHLNPYGWFAKKKSKKHPYAMHK